jgi:2-dehydro-3-deoxyphosphooctonate aldolase (KDO 8-P synthase)
VSQKPTIIAGPCMAESLEILTATADFLVPLAKKLDFDLVFKASFDKANRTSINSYRGPGMEQTMSWFTEIKKKHQCKIITDIHAPAEAAQAAEVCDVLQIPAFLCRQTDLIVAAAKTGKMINIKKGQFMSPAAMSHIVEKVRATTAAEGLKFNAALTERGASFGYGDLVVDMRSLAIMAEAGVPVFFDITHSTQQPAAGSTRSTSGALREFAPLLARSAAASGYVSGFFLETHPDPSAAKSDADAQLNFKQAEKLLEQIIPLMTQANKFAKNDDLFKN